MKSALGLFKAMTQETLLNNRLLVGSVTADEGHFRWVRYRDNSLSFVRTIDTHQLSLPLFFPLEVWIQSGLSAKLGTMANGLQITYHSAKLAIYHDGNVS